MADNNSAETKADRNQRLGLIKPRYVVQLDSPSLREVDGEPLVAGSDYTIDTEIEGTRLYKPPGEDEWYATLLYVRRGTAIDGLVRLIQADPSTRKRRRFANLKPSALPSLSATFGHGIALHWMLFTVWNERLPDLRASLTDCAPVHGDADTWTYDSVATAARVRMVCERTFSTTATSRQPAPLVDARDEWIVGTTCEGIRTLTSCFPQTSKKVRSPWRLKAEIRPV